MPTVIAAVGSYLPPRVVTNDELACKFDTSDRWIREHTGIVERRIATRDQACSDLAYPAALDALQKSAINAAELDLIIVATTTPDYTNFPATACLLQQKLAAAHCAAFDISAACSGFVYGISVAKAMIDVGQAHHALVVGSEVLSRVTDWQDRSTCVLFGDGAGAAVLSHSKTEGIIDTLLCANGELKDALIVLAGGSRLPPYEVTNKQDYYLKMDGRSVYNFAVRQVQDTITTLLERNNKTWQDLSYIVPHQANLRIIQAVAKREQIPIEKFYTNIDRYANTSSASIPIALAEMDENGLLTEGDLILLVGFGAGATWGGTLMRWNKQITAVEKG